MSVVFELERVEGDSALYLAASEAGRPTGYFFLLLGATTDLPVELDLPRSWGEVGVYVFANSRITVTLDLLKARLGIGAVDDQTRGVYWVEDGSVGEPVAAIGMFAMGQTREETNLVFGDLCVYVPSASAVTVGTQEMSVTDGGILFRRTLGGGPASLSPEGGRLDVGFGPADGGSLGFEADWEARDFFQLCEDPDPASGTVRGAEVRYFVPLDGSAPPLELAYPVTARASFGEQCPLSMECRVDLLRSGPGRQSRFSLRPESVPSALAEACARTTAGEAVALAPAPDGSSPCGFFLGVGPGRLGQSVHLYLAPLGRYALSVEESSKRPNLMCGLSALEYFQAGDGDFVDFVPGRPALAARPDASFDGSAPLLEDRFTTAWVSYQASAQEGRGYFAQPDASTSFADGAIPATTAGAMRLPAAVSARVWSPGPTGQSPIGPFPMAFYGASVTSSDVRPEDAERMVSLEQRVLAVVRGASIRSSSSRAAVLGAEGAPADPVFTDALGHPMTGTTSTPRGLLVELNDDAGTWKRVTLARSGEREAAIRSRSTGGAVDPWLVTSLLRDQSFLVLNRWEVLPYDTEPPVFERSLEAGGFNFQLAPDASDPPAERRRTILVAKYSTARSLESLVRDTDAWVESSYFVGNAEEVTAAKSVLEHAIQVSREPPPPGDPFAYFREVVASEAAWTGIVVFNAPIDGNGMPMDLQMLLAGVDGQLKAHHVGSEINRVVRGPNGPSMDDSALFGVIHYADGFGSEGQRSGPLEVTERYSYAVEELDVAIRNSRVTSFQAQVGVTFNELFGRPVQLQPQREDRPNTVSIKGQYQRQGDVGTVLFDAAQSATFAFRHEQQVRVTDSFKVTRASLSPISSVPREDDAGTVVTTRFSFDGSLAFPVDPFPGIAGFDLFSFGKPDGTGLGLSGLRLTITAKLDATGRSVPPLAVVPDLGSVLASSDRSGVRPGSLLDALPLSVSGFLYSPTGLDAKTLLGQTVNVLPLLSVQRPGPPVPGRPEDKYPAPPRQSVAFTSSKPQYGLRCRLPMGSLGDLADAHLSIDAYLTLAWGPSTATTDNDGALLVIQLPGLGGGAFGLDLQGLLKTTFGDANLMKVGSTYALLFNNVALSVLGLRLPPKVITDFIVFAGSEPGDELGWSLAATTTSGTAA